MTGVIVPSCGCTITSARLVKTGRRATLACSTCGALFERVAIDTPTFDEVMLDAQVNETRAGIMRAALVRLSTEVHYSARDKTGEESTRRVQAIASEALRKADEA